MEEMNRDLEKVADENKKKYKVKPETRLSESQDKAVVAQNLHNKLIVIQVMNYKKQGYTNIKVNHENYRQGQPAQISGYTPDLSADLKSDTMICEVETNESINDPDTVHKWREFDKSGCQFHLLIPLNAFDQVKDIAKSNGITIDKYWCSKDY